MLSAALLVGGCGQGVPTTAPAPSAGIGRDAAILMARDELSAEAQLVSAETGSSTPWLPAEPGRPAWIVRFNGSFPVECPAPNPTCPNLHSATVVLDAASGEVITAEYR